ncbi:MAG: type II toxin-antitoxin system RelE/ParE family toxin [Chromatiales bacterium]|nr:type II toxin-antitoxin system RelE/ParE family toxin [Chromatiales bacterium]
MVKSVREAVKVIAHQPGIGRPVEDMEPEHREWLIDFGDSGYVALYRYDGQTAVLLAVRHQREAGY